MSLVTLPGLIDMHVHLRDPGQLQKEDFATGTAAALAGGFTAVFDMPNNAQPITTAERLDEKIAAARQKTRCDIGFYFGSLGDNTDEFDKVKDTVWGLKLYLNQTTGGFIIDIPALERIYAAWESNTPILLHSEEDMIDQVLLVIEKTGKKSHICHVSGERELQAIIAAREKGIPVTCGVTPHHLFLSEEDGKRMGAYGTVKPPLKPKEDQAFLWNHITAIDAIESDHAPHTKEEKCSGHAPYGMPGLETTLPLLLTAVSQGRLTVDDIIRLCHDSPKKILGLSGETVSTVEVDTDAAYTVEEKNLQTKCGWSPFTGMTVKGKILNVTYQGKTVFAHEEVLANPGSGRVL